MNERVAFCITRCIVKKSGMAGKYLKYFIAKRWIRCEDTHNFDKTNCNKKFDILILMVE